MAEFNYFDYFIIALFGYHFIGGVIFGAKRIVINTIYSLLKLVATYFVVRALYSYFPNLYYNLWSLAFSAGVVYIVVAIALRLLKFCFIANHISHPGLLDRLLGMLIGAFKGAVYSIIVFFICAVVTSGSYMYSSDLLQLKENTNRLPYAEWLQKSKLSPYLHDICYDFNLIPDEWLSKITISNYDLLQEEIYYRIKRKHNNKDLVDYPEYEDVDVENLL